MPKCEACAEVGILNDTGLYPMKCVNLDHDGVYSFFICSAHAKPVASMLLAKGWVSCVFCRFPDTWRVFHRGRWHEFEEQGQQVFEETLMS